MGFLFFFSHFIYDIVINEMYILFMTLLINEMYI